MTGIEETPWDEEVGDQAIAWLVRVRSDAATADDWAALTSWLEISPAHRAAFESYERLDLEIDDLAERILAGLARPTAEIVLFPKRPARAAKPSWGVRRAVIAAGFAAFAAFVGVGTWRASEGTAQVYRTAVGETRAITLADGSHVRMDAASTMSVRLGWFKRQVDLGDGEATFDVGKDPKRPFEVAVRDQTVRDIGTEFNIRNYDGIVKVTVRRGIVVVFQPNLSSQPIARLTPGWALSHAAGSAQSDRAQVDPDQAFAWTEGRLICNDQPLSEILAYLNRRYGESIHIPAGAADRRFTGVLELGDRQDVMRRLAGFLSLSIHRSDRGIVLS